MADFTKLLSALSTTLSNPLLYTIALFLGIMYTMWKNYSEKDEKRYAKINDIIKDTRQDLSATRKQLDESQMNNREMSKVIQQSNHLMNEQMAEHRHAIEKVVVVMEEMRRDIQTLRVDVKEEIDDLRDEVRRDKNN